MPNLSSSGRSDRLRPSTPIRWLGAAAIVAAGIIAYAPTLDGERQWDDGAEIFQNALLRSPSGLLKAWVAPQGPDYLPLKTSVEWILWHLWQGTVAGHHGASIALHLLSALLLWRVLERLGVRFAWLGGLLFAIHPLATESVAWMSELKNTLSLPPLLASFLAFLSFHEAPGVAPPSGGEGESRDRGDGVVARAFQNRGCYAWSLMGFIAALLCKSSVVMFPVVLLGYCIWRAGRFTARDLRATAPFFAASLAFGIVTLKFQTERAIGDLTMPSTSLLARLGAAWLNLNFYLEKCLLPIGLSPVYSGADTGSAVVAPLVLGCLLAAGVAWFWVQRATWGGGALFALACFAANLAPVLGILPMSFARISRVSDHLAYISLACACGAAAAAAGALVAWIDSVPMAVRGRRRLLARTAAAALVALLMVQTRSYGLIFHDPISLWTRAVDRSPDSWFAQNNLGSALLHRDDAAGALQHLEAARRLNPRAAEVQVNLGDALLKLHRAPEAIAADREALQLEPDFSSAHYNLANALVASGRISEALLHYTEAVRLEPDSAEFRYNYGTALAEAGRLDEAAGQLAESVRLDPKTPETRINYANVLAALGRLAEARSQFEAALRLRPGDPDAHFGIADTLMAMGRPAEAMPHYDAALRARPEDPAIRAARDAALRRLGR